MRRVGWTEFAAFRRCPSAYFQNRALQTEPPNHARDEGRERGRLMHAVVEQFYRKEFWRDPKPLDRMYEALQTAAKDTPPAFLSQVILVTELLPGVLQTIKDNQLVGPECLVEFPVSLEVTRYGTDGRETDGLSLEGRLDYLIRGLDGSVKLIDGKTGSVADKDQLRMYAMALRQVPHWGQPNYLGIWHYRKHRVEWVRFTSADEKTFLEKLSADVGYYLSAVPEAAEAKVGYHCKFCPFTIGCEPYREKIRSKQAVAPEVPVGGGFVSLE